MLSSQSGRTFIEILAVLCFMGIFTISGFKLYAKAMNTIRVNRVMEEVYVKVNELSQNNRVSARRNGKIVDIGVQETNKKFYGYTIVMSDTKRNTDGSIEVKINGNFTSGMQEILMKRYNNREYLGLMAPQFGEDYVLFKIDPSYKNDNSSSETSVASGLGEDPDTKRISDSNTSCSKENCGAGCYLWGGECYTCPVGYYCIGDGIQRKCPDGKVSEKGSSYCSLCPSGTFPTEDASKCEICPPGYSCE